MSPPPTPQDLAVPRASRAAAERARVLRASTRSIAQAESGIRGGSATCPLAPAPWGGRGIETRSRRGVRGRDASGWSPAATGQAHAERVVEMPRPPRGAGAGRPA
ncbi:MAG: hypothetical protein A3G44_17700 [Candidatus Rokubacteria bacterium RIFCSPLOWO2_12_FULL_73_47]|nr:MAG: hypothetical protein A3G44_17700 [Candidatus Rokubacteria bacterium RIFCSPLOWO2_12_FULL_73_47]